MSDAKPMMANKSASMTAARLFRDATFIVSGGLCLVASVAICVSALRSSSPPAWEAPSERESGLPACIDMGAPDGGDEPGMFCPYARMDRILSRLDAAEAEVISCHELRTKNQNR